MGKYLVKTAILDIKKSRSVAFPSYAEEAHISLTEWKTWKKWNQK